MRVSEWRYLILSDLYRIEGNTRIRTFIYHLVIGEAYRYIFWMRTARLLRSNTLTKHTIYPFSLLIMRHFSFQLGISIPLMTNVSSGLMIYHFGGIVVNGNSVIGKNCTLSHGVTIGHTLRGTRKGSPVIGDNVFIAPGAKIIGAIHIGSNVAIGTNSVVTKDVPDNAVVVGIPAKVVSNSGSSEYVNNINYDPWKGVRKVQ